MKKLGQILLDHGWITPEQLVRALNNQKTVGGRIGTCLLEIDVLPENLLLRALSEQLGVPGADAEDLRGVSEEIYGQLPAKVARRCRAVPFRWLGGQLYIAMLGVRNLAFQDEIAFVTGKRLKVHIANEVRICEALAKYYGEECPSRFEHLLDRVNRARFLWARDSSVAGGEEAPAAESSDVLRWSLTPETPAEPRGRDLAAELPFSPFSPAPELPSEVAPPRRGRETPGKRPATTEAPTPAPVAEPLPTPAAAAPGEAPPRVRTAAEKAETTTVPAPVEPQIPVPTAVVVAPAPAPVPPATPGTSAPSGAPPAPRVSAPPRTSVVLPTEPAAPDAADVSPAEVVATPAVARPAPSRPVAAPPTPPSPTPATVPPAPAAPTPAPAADAAAPPAAVAAIPAPVAPAPTAEPAADETQPVPALAPLDLATAEARLVNPTDRDEVGRVLLDFLAPRCRRSALFMVRKEGVQGWLGQGELLDPVRLKNLSLGFNQPSVFLGLREGAFHRGPLAPLPAHRRLAECWGGAMPAECVVVPVRIRERLVTVIYADGGDTPLAGISVVELQRLAAKAGIAFELCIMRNKLRQA